MTHCRKCGVLEEVGESVICENCADTESIIIKDYYSAYDIACAALVLGLGILTIDIAIVVVRVAMSV